MDHVLALSPSFSLVLVVFLLAFPLLFLVNKDWDLHGGLGICEALWVLCLCLSQYICSPLPTCTVLPCRPVEHS